MRETFTAMLPVAGGGATFYQATGPFATEIIQRIANIAGLKSVDSMPDNAFGCRFTEIQREEAEKYISSPDPEVITYPENYLTVHLNPKKKIIDVYLVKGRYLNEQKTGFLMRCLYYLGVLPLLIHANTVCVHGILAELNGKGAIISGPSGIGKSTAARRLPPPWKIHSDDCLLLTDTGNGIFAQPVPTWSIYFANTDKPRTFDGTKTVKVEGLFMLDRDKNAVEPLDKMQAIVGFTKSIGDMTKLELGRMPDNIRKELFLKALSLGTSAVRKIPAYHLFATIDGDFWTPMRQVFEL